MIRFDGVSKSFRIYRRPSHWLSEKLLRRPRHEIRPALRDISFAVEPGEVFGVLGQNGAGKSTLLKLTMGVLLPDGGSITKEGRVTGLLELGTGFNAQFSGYDNIAFNGVFLGMTPAEVEAKRDSIIDFSELADAIANPLRTYSSGMVMRLAFAIAIHADPSCLVVDEALAVGDAHFQQKCMRRLRELKEGGTSILFVSHDLNAVKILCDRALVLEKGSVAMIGEPQEAVDHYNRIIARMEADEHTRAFPEGGAAPPATSYGAGQVEILSGEICGRRSGGRVVSSGEMVDIVIEAEARQSMEDVTVGIVIRDRFGQDVFGTNTNVLGRTIALRQGERRSFIFSMPMDIAPGAYTISAALHGGDVHLTDCYHWCDCLMQFEVAGFDGPRFVGMCGLKPAFSERASENV